MSQTTAPDANNRYARLRWQIAGIIEPALTGTITMSEPFHERSARLAADQLAQFKAEQILNAVREAGIFQPLPPSPPSSPAS
jgi:hypothetical protein